ncbi:MAG TPA: HAD hydrolase family protein [Nitrososphaeraceae archaeon]|nr:HAD hydrolase family protein [Nitrososphaeraceae archaeon]
MKISAIVSDYDGTICPTSSIYSKVNPIPEDLYSILLKISSKIPVCILSSKPFDFLVTSCTFAKIISCILGIETIVFSEKSDLKKIGLSTSHLLDDYTTSFYIYDKEKLLSNSPILEDLSVRVMARFSDLRIEKKYTFKENVLAGLTFDYRHLLKWENYKSNIEPIILNRINEYIKNNSLYLNDINVKTYTSHPFIDIYSTKFDKGKALDKIRQILNFDNNEKILYLGDSENDDPAFLKADLSINIHSDERINTELKAHYGLEFNELTNFLTRLHDLDFHFSNMLTMS